jgi:DNA-binding Lrp family transcriptional regulator
MSRGSLLLARLADHEHLVPAAEILEHSDIVEGWNAVDGHINLVAKLKAPSQQLVDQIRGLGGAQELEVIQLSDETGTFRCDPSLCSSFVFLEVEAAKLADVLSRLSTLQQVAFCSSRQGSSELIAVVNGATYQLLDRTIDELIRPIDGVLRLKRDRVINLKQL